MAQISEETRTILTCERESLLSRRAALSADFAAVNDALRRIEYLLEVEPTKYVSITGRSNARGIVTGTVKITQSAYLRRLVIDAGPTGLPRGEAVEKMHAAGWPHVQPGTMSVRYSEMRDAGLIEYKNGIATALPALRETSGGLRIADRLPEGE